LRNTLNVTPKNMKIEVVIIEIMEIIDVSTSS
jgi:hypothetical protein